MALNNTVWPADLPPPESTKAWLAKLYATVDSKDADSGAKLASLYTSDAVVYGLHGKSEGTEAIIQSRSTAWDHIERRDHQVLRVFTASRAYSDIILVGELTVDFKNGKQVTAEFIARIVFEQATGSDPLKASLYQVWGDSSPWTKAAASK
ncbi:hypothetical protein CDV36_012043 [Fusarium kuroshium]|uniref:SnoaL-like domain-containing protein n=1 Tax=Fusarium kuroshium TaxID=2010991 RepID=A0A3M2RST9_9HYPO|nr:hypothetical protein CDV36_012043 [Fusarium kuroshium]